jgi:hypothetical protein
MAAYFYLYGLIPTIEAGLKMFDPFTGIDNKHKAYVITLGSITAIGTDVDADEFSEKAIKEKMDNDMIWLEEKAMHHHEVLSNLQKQYTVLPMKFCTIFKNIHSLEQKVDAEQEKIHDSFVKIKGNEEWNLKIYSDDTLVREQLRTRHPTIAAKMKEIEHLPPGRQFFEKRKIEQLLDQETEKEINEKCEEIHNEVKQFSIFSTVKRNWGKELTGKPHDMSWNSVYLIPLSNVEAFLEDVEKKTWTYEKFGWKIEVSGPWPAYHFANLA